MIHGDPVVQTRMGLRLLLDLNNSIDKYLGAFNERENDRIDYVLARAATARADAGLAGMKRLLTENKTFLQVEIWQENVAEILPLLQGWGYTRVKEIGHDYYFQDY